jgi:hypothetical protein
MTCYGANMVKGVCDVLNNDGPRSAGMLSIAPCVEFDVRRSSIAIMLILLLMIIM